MHSTLLKPYKLLPKYPGLRPQDEALWDQFVHKNPEAFTHVYYNVHLGDPVGNNLDRAEMIESGMFDVSQWLVDVLAYDNKKEYVIEIKPNAGPGALGQVLSYTKILQFEGRISSAAVPIIITDAISEILKDAANLLNVKVIIP